jgi:class 3 adenylate cyclase
VIAGINAARFHGKIFGGFLINQRLVVVTTGQYYWTGTRAGLVPPARLFTANGQKVHSPKQFDEILQKAGEATVIHYEFERLGQTMEKNIPTMRFSMVDLVLSFGIPFVAGLVFIFISAIVFILKPDTVLSWCFLVACYFLGIFSITSFDLVSTHWGFLRLYFLAEVTMAAAAVHLSLIFPEKRKIYSKFPKIAFLPYLLAVVLLVPVLVYYPGPVFLRFYKWFSIYMLVSIIALILSPFITLIVKSSRLARQRAKVVLTGVAFAFPLPVFVNTFPHWVNAPEWSKIPDSVTAITMIFFPASIAYAIARHNLFDVDVFIKRAVGYVIMTVVIAITYISMEVGLKTIFISSPLYYPIKEVFPFLFALVILFFFHPVNHKIRSTIDKLFYRTQFDYKKAVTSVSNALSSILDLDEVIKRIINTVRHEMFIDSAGIILLQPEEHECQALFIHDSHDGTEVEVDTECLPLDDPLVLLAQNEKELITSYDIEENRRFAPLRHTYRERLKALKATLVLPILFKGEVIGILTLGLKKSGHFYSSEDIELLQTLVSQGAIAIENAKLAEDMRSEMAVKSNLVRYLPKQVVDQVINGGIDLTLDGSRKSATILYSDIQDFTGVTRPLSAQQMVTVLSEYFREMAEVIFHHGGSLEKYVGDSIVAVFGGWVDLADPTDKAVQTAVNMMKMMKQLNKKWVADYDGFSMGISVGIATGEIFLGNVGTAERVEYTVLGETVNVARRLADLAGSGQIYITARAISKLGADVSAKEHSPITLKGDAGKLKVFELQFEVQDL